MIDYRLHFLFTSIYTQILSNVVYNMNDVNSIVVIGSFKWGMQSV